MISSAKESYCCCFHNEDEVFNPMFLKLSYYKISVLQMFTTYPQYNIGIKNHSSCLIKFCLLKVLFAWHTKYTRHRTHCFTSILLLHILCHRYIYDFIYYVIGMTYTRLCHRWLMFLNWLINAVVLPQTEKKLCSPSQSSTADLAFGSLIHHEGWCYTVGPNVKNPPKIRLKKFVKLTGHTCACNNLTSFEYEDHAKTGNGSYEYSDTCTKKLVKSLWGNLFLAGF